MADCGDIGMLENGTIKESQIISSTLTTCALDACTLSGSTITGTVAVDNITAKAILDALVALGPDQLATLGRLLLTSGSAVASVTAPPEVESSSVPTKFYGSKTAALGNPATWGNIGGYKVPMYSGS